MSENGKGPGAPTAVKEAGWNYTRKQRRAALDKVGTVVREAIDATGAEDRVVAMVVLVLEVAGTGQLHATKQCLLYEPNDTELNVTQIVVSQLEEAVLGAAEAVRFGAEERRRQGTGGRRGTVQ